MISKELLKQRFCNASSTYNEHAIVQAKMAKELVQMASGLLPKENYSMLELGCGTGLLTKQILRNFESNNYLINDIVPDIEKYMADIIMPYDNTYFDYIFGDIEHLNFPQGQNVIWSGATIQWVQDLPAFFKNISNVIESNGYLIFSTFGPDNYSQIKSITGRGIEYLKMEELLKSALPYFTVVKAKESKETLLFNSPVEVLKHMRLTGVNAISEKCWTKGDLENFNAEYEKYKTDDKYRLTYHPFYLVLKLKGKQDDSCWHIDYLKSKIEDLK